MIDRSDCNVHNSFSRIFSARQMSTTYFVRAVKIRHVTERRKDKDREIGEYPNEKTFDQPEETFGQRERKHSFASPDMSSLGEEKRRDLLLLLLSFSSLSLSPLPSWSVTSRRVSTNGKYKLIFFSFFYYPCVQRNIRQSLERMSIYSCLRVCVSILVNGRNRGNILEQWRSDGSLSFHLSRSFLSII